MKTSLPLLPTKIILVWSKKKGIIKFLFSFYQVFRRKRRRSCFYTLFKQSQSDRGSSLHVVKVTFMQSDNGKGFKEKTKIIQIYCFPSDFPTNQENFLQAWKRDHECKRFNSQLHMKNTKISFFYFNFSFLPANFTVHITNLCSLVCRPLFVTLEKCS